MIAAHKYRGSVMPRLISQVNAARVQKSLLRPLKGMQKWLSGEESMSAHIICTSNCLIRTRKAWNTQGREIFDRELIAEHAFHVITVLRKMKLNAALAQMRQQRQEWFGKAAPKRRNCARFEYLRSINSRQALQGFRGGILFESLPICFINHFIDYAYENRCSDIVILFRREPLVVCMTHHLTVDFITPDARLYSGVKDYFLNSGLRLVQNAPLVFSNPHVRVW